MSVNCEHKFCRSCKQLAKKKAKQKLKKREPMSPFKMFILILLASSTFVFVTSVWG